MFYLLWNMRLSCPSTGLGKWVEIGNSGMFRPEMLEPMGLGPEVRVIAWGLSLERPTMIKYGIDNIREVNVHPIIGLLVGLFEMCLEFHGGNFISLIFLLCWSILQLLGHKVKLEIIETNPICRLEMASDHV
jgi:hypothetical protein